MGSSGARVEAFLSRFCRHSEGRQFIGRPFDLEQWQREFVYEAFETDDATGLRQYREVLLGIPRKNGKSSLASGLALYLLLADDEAGPQVFATAAAKDQARIVFRQVTKFIEASPRLGDLVIPRQYHVESPGNGGILRVLSSDAPLQHGLNPSGVVVDELHAHKSGDLYTAMVTGTGARVQPVTLTITTAGYDGEQILGQIYNGALADEGRVERRDGLTIVRDPASRFLMYWFGADPGDDPDDPATWRKANPASWITDDFIGQQRALVRRGAMRLADFRRYHLNQWVDVEEDWLPTGAWAACREGQPDPRDPLAGLDPRAPVNVGIDFGVADDTTAVVVAQRVPMPEGRRMPEVPHPEDLVRIRARFFVPDPDRGEEADVAEILDYLRSLRVRFPVPMRKPDRQFPAGPIYLYDPWGFRAMASILENEGLVMEDVPQNDSRMVPASTDLYSLVISKRLRHNGDPVLARHIANVVGRARGESGWRITKLKDSPTKKIDGAVAAAMAASAALRPWPAPRVRAFVA